MINGERKKKFENEKAQTNNHGASAPTQPREKAGSQTGEYHVTLPNKEK
jgi:hypothetical protein